MSSIQSLLVDGKSSLDHPSEEQLTRDTHECKIKPLMPSESHSRTGSVYTLSRLSFASQITQLTSIPLPQPCSLLEAIQSIPTAMGALCVLEDAAYQISKWIKKAIEVLSDLDADGDIEWAITAGRSGILQVNEAIGRFEILIKTYVECVEHLRLRSDAETLPQKTFNHTLDQIEKIANSWSITKQSLESVKQQVELSIEWGQLQNCVFRPIESEMDHLCGTVFEMEEMRYRQHSRLRGVVSKSRDSASETFDTTSSCSPTNCFSVSSRSPDVYSNDEDIMRVQDEKVLALFARMQPLRTSLDFLPIKCTTFQLRASLTFSSTCAQLDEHIRTLSKRWERLVSDAETLKKELGEDRWLIVFQNAAGQALEMIDSVTRSIAAVDESLGNDTSAAHATSTLRKIETYHAKKVHYCPAIEQILSITSDGLSERTTINGEIVRLQAKLLQDWSGMKAAIKVLDSTLGTYVTDDRLRDSVSSIDSSKHLHKSSPGISSRSSPPSSLAALSTRSSCQYLVGLATDSPSIVSTPSSIRAQRSHTRLPVTPRTPSRPGNFVSPHSGSSRSIDTPPTPDSGRQYRVSPLVADRPRWNYSTKLGSSGMKIKFDRVAAANCVPYYSSHMSPVTLPPTAYSARFGHPDLASESGPTKTLIPKDDNPKKDSPLPSISSSPCKIPRMKVGGVKCITTVPRSRIEQQYNQGFRGAA